MPMKLEKEESLCLAYFQSSKVWERLLEGFKKNIVPLDLLQER